MGIKIELNEEEKEMIIIGLNMRRNYIETGDVNYSASNVEVVKGLKINPLNVDQMRLIIKTEELINKLFNSVSINPAHYPAPPPPPEKIKKSF